MILRRLSMRFKITTVVSVVVLFGCLTLGGLTMVKLAEVLGEQVGYRAQSSAWALASTADPLDLAAVERGKYDAPQYAFLKQMVTSFQKDVELAYAGLFVRPDGYTALPLVNTEGDLSFTPFEPVDTTSLPVFGMIRTGSGTVNLDGHYTEYVAGWQPIELDGKPYGLAVVLVDASDVIRTVRQITLTLFVFILLFTMMAGYSAYRFASSFERSALLDGLMGIFNHKHFKQRLEVEVEKSRRHGQQTSLVLIDIDHFKKVNDTYGHQVGDFVLKQMALVVTAQARKTDIVARYGGEEIVVVLPFTGLSGAQQFAERLRLKVQETLFEDREEEVELRVTCSIGVARWESGMTMTDLIRHADTALYQSKHGGRNRVTLYQDEGLVNLTQGEAPAPATR
jgi:diguanylate cyclase (GGDEF)-like protein